MSFSARQVFIGEYGDSLEVAAIAERREAEGFDGILVGDSQSRYADPFVTLATIAHRTESLLIGTAVSNPATRHPAVFANAFASLQHVSGGRAIAGIGRGDSSLAFIGGAPAPLDAFQRYIRDARRYLHGQDVDISTPPTMYEGTQLRASGDIGLHDRPVTGRLNWIDSMPVVPLDVFATGPRMIAMAAVHADRLTLSVGADPDRIAWGVKLAQRARHEAGLDPDQLDIGASFAVALSDDLDAARQMIAGVVSVMARFAVMHGGPTGPVDQESSRVLERVAAEYDMTRHGRHDNRQGAVIDDDFLMRYAVVGGPETCINRIDEIFRNGIRRVHLVFHAQGVDPEDVERSHQRFAAEVLPALR